MQKIDLPRKSLGVRQEDRAYSKFINSINAEETKTKYVYCLKDFMKFLDIKEPSDLLKIKDIEQSVIDYVLYLRKNVSSATLHTRLATVYHFYDMNHVVLSKVIISKYKGEFIKVKNDRAYSREEIHKLLEVADLRIKICILLMSSSCLRLGAIPDLRLSNLQKINDIYKITVYQGTKQQYYTFTTVECANFIDEYIKYRRRYGENITPKAYLIREQFDDFSKPKEPRKITKHAIREIIYHFLKKTGVLTTEVQMTTGFRKFFITESVNSGVNPIHGLMLEGHSTGIRDHYARPTEQKMYEEFQKMHDNVTISEENRLKKKIEILQVEKSKLEILSKDVELLKQRYKKLKSEKV